MQIKYFLNNHIIYSLTLLLVFLYGLFSFKATAFFFYKRRNDILKMITAKVKREKAKWNNTSCFGKSSKENGKKIQEESKLSARYWKENRYIDSSSDIFTYLIGELPLSQNESYQLFCLKRVSFSKFFSSLYVIHSLIYSFFQYIFSKTGRS